MQHVRTYRHVVTYITLLFFLITFITGAVRWWQIETEAEDAFQATMTHICFLTESISCKPPAVSRRGIEYAIHRTDTSELQQIAERALDAELQKPWSSRRRIELYIAIIKKEREQKPSPSAPATRPVIENRPKQIV